VTTLKATAFLSVRLWIDCPECDEQMDILDHGYLNDEGQHWKIMETWGQNESWKNLGQEIECESCKKIFIWDQLEY
jgi:hypothetical protein